MSDDKYSRGDHSDRLLYCSFCGKSQDEVKKLIAGPSVYICNECVDLCNNIITQELLQGEGEPEKSDLQEKLNSLYQLTLLQIC